MKTLSLKKFLVRGFLGSGGVRFLFSLLSFFLTMLLARSLGPEGYGLYAFVFAIVSLLAIPSQAGIPALVVREVASYHQQEKWGLIKGLLQRAGQWVLTLSILMALGFVIYAMLTYDDSNSHVQWVFFWGALLIPLMSLNAFRSAVLRGFGKVVLGQIPELLLAPFLFLMAVFFFHSMLEFDASIAMFFNCCAVFIAFIIGWLMLHKTLPNDVYVAQPTYEMKRWLTSVLPFALIAGIQVVNLQVSVVAIGILQGDSETGLFRVAFQLANVVSLTLIAINMVIAPKITQLFQKNELERLQKMVSWSSLAAFLVALPIAMIFISYGDVLLDNLFGSAYGQAETALIILTIGQLFSVMMGPVAVLLNMTGFETDTMRGVMLAMVCNVFFNILLIPFFSIEGAAWATAISVVVWNTYLFFKVKKRLGVSSFFYARP